MVQIKIRLAKMPDAKFVHRGIKDIVKIEEGAVWIERFLKRSDRLKKISTAIRKKQIFVAFYGEKQIGAVWYIIAKKCPYGVDYGAYSKKYIWINFSFVLKDFRNRGVGTKLYNEVFKVAKRKGIRALVTDVFAMNKRSMRFHKKVGFKPKIYLLFRER